MVLPVEFVGSAHSNYSNWEIQCHFSCSREQLRREVAWNQTDN